MNENRSYLKSYESVSDEVKYISNSVIRLKVLAALYEGPQNMKDLTDMTKVNYSSVSSTIHGLELKDFVYRESNKYHLSNSLKIQMEHVLELKDIVNLLNNFFNIIDGHVVDMIPNESIAELYLLGKANLLESDGINVYKIYDFIEKSLDDANRVQCILPFYYNNFNEKFDELVNEGKFVEAIVSQDVLEIYKEKSQIKYLSSFEGKDNFLLISTDKIMILGLFKDDGFFDQNRILTSKNNDSVKWGKNLFRNFKNRNK